ncbi:MAG TPA: hypothetical protein VGB73_16465 [Pyrinomonadaceae bacterium]|jgi:hypothetical protein
MARGWESKSVADQMEQTDTRAAEQATRYEISPAVRARRERLESLKLSHARTSAQLERATATAHREMLHRTLRALESEMAELR